MATILAAERVQCPTCLDYFYTWKLGKHQGNKTCLSRKRMMEKRGVQNANTYSECSCGLMIVDEEK
jgi:alpha-mannosidase